MPHATSDDTTGDMDAVDELQNFLNPNSATHNQFHERVIDQRDKADDAVDYEDISDDDELPEEEQASHPLDDADDGFYHQVPGGLGGLPTQPQANGYHDVQEPGSDELFEADDGLFADRTSLPEQERQQQQRPVQPASRPSGLALPTKSAAALPSYTGLYQPPRPQQPSAQYSPTSMSPPSFRDVPYAHRSPSSVLDSEDETLLDEETKLQRSLFRKSKRKQAGEEIAEERTQVNMETFYSLFPGYEYEENPRFLDLFPQREAQYRGKVPLKPPKPVQPTKLSLDLLLDQERSFKSPAATKGAQDGSHAAGIVRLDQTRLLQEDSDDDMALSAFDEAETIGCVNMADLALICEDWDVPSVETESMAIEAGLAEHLRDGEWDVEEHTRPSKKLKTDVLEWNFSLSLNEPNLSFENPERATAKLAKTVTLDLNDPNLLIDEHAPQTKRLSRRSGDARHDADAAKDLARRYNISNDMAYDLLKENHQHKVRSTLGSMALEHSLPASKLQYPYYKVTLDAKSKRAFHRPALDLRDPKREYKFQRMKTVKKKNVRGREVKDLFATAENLALSDNAHMLLLEYSEEAPILMSNFGMGNRLINYYRKRNADDQERPKRDIGETHVLLTQDKSPFANFGHVDQGEIVPTLQNGLYRAPIFQHGMKPTDFLVVISSTYEGGSRLYLRNLENLHIVGQQLPFVEVPTEHSRKVTDAAKKRLRALSYRIFTKSRDSSRRDKQLDNATLIPHLPGHDMPQTRSKMREFMKYERMPNKEGGVWVPLPGQVVPDAETLRSWIKPEEVCLLDSMQVGVQHLDDLNLKDNKGQEERDDYQDDKDNIEIKLAPWRTTKNFLGATQGKAMLKLHGEGDPTGRGEGLSFVKTSMKGGFQASGESIEDKLDAKKRRENGGHSYNVAKQQKLYEDDIRKIWDKQKRSLTSQIEVSDTEMDDEPDAEPDSTYPFGRAGTPRSSIGTPAAFARRDDETMTQHSRGSTARESNRVLIITRQGGRDKWGRPQQGGPMEVITDAKVIREYKRRRRERLKEKIDLGNMDATGNPELDNIKREHIEEELARVQRNVERREARERQKGRVTGASPSAAGSPGPSDAEGSSAIGGSTDGTPQKGPGRGRNKEGTARKCANCGQVGHIKTNRKLCPMLNGTMKTDDANANGDSSFGAVPAPLTL